MSTLHLAQWAFYALAAPIRRRSKRWALGSWRKPDPGMLSKASLERDQPHVAFLTIAAWRNGKSIVRCDGDLWEALQKPG